MPKIALLADHKAESCHTVEVDWPRWKNALRELRETDCAPCKGHDCEHKRGKAWIPARFILPEDSRKDERVEAITFGVFDIDAPTREQLITLAKALDGTEYLMHETHAKGSFRLVFPLTQEIPVGMWPQVWERIQQRFNIPGDPTCSNAARIYFIPSAPRGETRAIYEGAGATLDWTKLDAMFPGGAAQVIRQFKESVKEDLQIDPHDPKNLREGALDLEEMRKAVAAMKRPESRELLDTILSGRRLAEIGMRDQVLNRACSLLATAPLGKPYPTEAIVALLHGSLRAMDTEPEGLDHWLDQAREKYTRALSRRLERDAKSEADKAAILRVLGKDVSPTDEEDGWRSQLIFLLGKDGEPGGVRPVGANAYLIFEKDPGFKGFIRFNEITKEIEISGGVLAGKSKSSLDVEAMNWLAQSEYRLYLSSSAVGEQLLAVARAHAYNPIREWLESLRWDGVDRVPGFWIDYFGAQGEVKHLQAIARCFLVGMVARVMEPGCEVHTVPILIGSQGVGKSRGLKALAYPHFSDTKIEIGSKDAQVTAASNWLIELAELSSIRNTDIESIKNFVSQAESKIRLPYGRVPETLLRMCVMAGTTNDDEPLTDWTGDRRWWPFVVTKGDVEGIKRDRDQIFAQALKMYRDGVQWHLTPEEQNRANEIATGFRRPGARAEQILAWFSAKIPEQRPAELTTFECLNTVLGIPSGQINHAMSMEVGKALRSLGFTKHRKYVGGATVNSYRTPPAILKMAKDSKPVSVQIVVEAKTS